MLSRCASFYLSNKLTKPFVVGLMFPATCVRIFRWSTADNVVKPVPVLATHAYTPRKGPLAYLERCAKCNKPEADHKVVSRNQIRAAANERLWLLRDLLTDSNFSSSRRVKVSFFAPLVLKNQKLLTVRFVGSARCSRISSRFAQTGALLWSS